MLFCQGILRERVRVRGREGRGVRRADQGKGEGQGGTSGRGD